LAPLSKGGKKGGECPLVPPGKVIYFGEGKRGGGGRIIHLMNFMGKKKEKEGGGNVFKFFNTWRWIQKKKRGGGRTASRISIYNFFRRGREKGKIFCMQATQGVTKHEKRGEKGDID